jgi:hypothetical protein
MCACRSFFATPMSSGAQLLSMVAANTLRIIVKAIAVIYGCYQRIKIINKE